MAYTGWGRKQRKAFGQKVGPTGRKRDEFDIGVTDRHKQDLYKAYGGRTTLEAYGQQGVKEAKRSTHKRFPHRWIKFSVHNHSRLSRQVHKRWEAEKAKKGKKK